MTPTSAPTPRRRVHLAACGWFWVWALVGLGAGAAVVSLGPVVAVPAAVAGVAMARRPAIRRSAFGLLTGAGASLLVVAFVQRSGPPGHLDPLPWLALGAVLLGGGVAGHAGRVRPQ